MTAFLESRKSHSYIVLLMCSSTIPLDLDQKIFLGSPVTS